jgi:hypothetical protein
VGVRLITPFPLVRENIYSVVFYCVNDIHYALVFSTRYANAIPTIKSVGAKYADIILNVEIIFN